ncbi:Tripartite motif-containing protein 15 [Chelonia mydas]|uniref:Tripartite motif-containing protein 15 n=1 Tax=Chelonia mydas TaxID=8469 RepID=M7AL56_CHEMY|nr:Tripartite motif-containing protein 15 [Chelonia mydas]
MSSSNSTPVAGQCQLTQEQVETKRLKILSESEQLWQFLEEQKPLLLARLEELDKEIEKRRDENIAKLLEELSCLNDMISELEGKCQQPASEFLQAVDEGIDHRSQDGVEDGGYFVQVSQCSSVWEHVDNE